VKVSNHEVHSLPDLNIKIMFLGFFMSKKLSIMNFFLKNCQPGILPSDFLMFTAALLQSDKISTRQEYF
jgi:hypothetical protein